MRRADCHAFVPFAIPILLSLSTGGCAAHRPPRQVTQEAIERMGLTPAAPKYIYLGMKHGHVTLQPTVVDYPFLSGRVVAGNGNAQINLTDVASAQIMAPAKDGTLTPTADIDVSLILKEPTVIRSKTVRFNSATGTVTLRNPSPALPPWVEGRLADAGGVVRVNIAEVRRIEVLQPGTDPTVTKTKALTIKAIGIGVYVLAAYSLTRLVMRLF